MAYKGRPGSYLSTRSSVQASYVLQLQRSIDACIGMDMDMDREAPDCHD
jgi:hypothetical protein